MQGKEEDQHACRGVATMVPCPVVMDVLEKCRIEDLNLRNKERKFHYQTVVVDSGLEWNLLASTKPHKLSSSRTRTNRIYVAADIRPIAQSYSSVQIRSVLALGEAAC